MPIRGRSPSSWSVNELEAVVDAAGLDQFRAATAPVRSDPTAVLSLRGPPAALTSTRDPPLPRWVWRGPRAARGRGRAPAPRRGRAVGRRVPRGPFPANVADCGAASAKVDGRRLEGRHGGRRSPAAQGVVETARQPCRSAPAQGAVIGRGATRRSSVGGPRGALDAVEPTLRVQSAAPHRVGSP